MGSIVNVLKVKLPSGAWRYVTRLTDTDFGYSIYATNAVEGTPHNLRRANKVVKLHKLKNVKIKIVE